MLTLAACGSALAPAPVQQSDDLVAGQGQQLQGQQLQGQQLQGQQLQGAGLGGAEQPLIHSYDGWMLKNRTLKIGAVSQGRLVGDGGKLTGAELVGVAIPATQGGATVWTIVRSASPDPSSLDGSTWLYGLDVVNADGTTTPFCRADADGVAAAIPLAAYFDTSGNRVESTTQFSFGCTAGVVAKCIRWGYRPWLGLENLHWSCTRMARADYCGDGTSWTYDGTLINLWDRAPAPGPYNTHGTPPPDFVFEAGWSTHGAVCLSKQRWLTLPLELALRCPDRLIAPGLDTLLGTVCDTDLSALGFDSTTQLFNESRLNIK